ncbi:MAG: leucine-rich repeat domain-containing protein [Treponema sp.]|nr:leucine-rich repeat domain-containing protein [Treponema sp.]
MKKQLLKTIIPMFTACAVLIAGNTYASASTPENPTLYTGEEITVPDMSDETKIEGKLVDLRKQKNASVTEITLGKDVTAVISSYEDYYESGNDVAIRNEYISLISGFPKLESVAVEEGNQVLKSDDGILYTFNGKQLTACPLQKSGAVKVAEGTEKIDVNAFMNCKKITSVTIPKSVTKIDEGAFGNNTACKKFVVAKGNKKYTAVNGVLYTKDKKTLVAYPSGKTKKSFTMPKGVTKIAAAAFMGNAHLKNVKFAVSVKTVGDSAFLGSKKLKTVNAKSKVKTLAAGSFYKCKKLTKITFKKKGLKNIYAESFTGDKKLNITIPKSAKIDLDAGLKDAKKIKCYIGSAGESYCKERGKKYKTLGL